MNPALRLSAFALTALVAGACSPDFQLAGMDKPAAVADTGGRPDADTGAPEGDEDTGSPGAGGDDTGETDSPAEGSDPEDDFVPTEDEPGDSEAPTDDPAPADDCTETSDLIYVLDKDSGSISLFDPASGGLSTLGTPDCDTWSTPASMAVARDGVAYVRMGDNEIFAVTLDTLDCQPTSYRNSSFGSFGMGFATTAADTWRDTLFIASASALAALDRSTWQPTALGSMPSQGELTGTGSGELWAVLPLASPLELVELDQASGATLRTVRPATTLDIGNLDTFAFAAWGGDFYLFLRFYGMGNSTEVWRIGRDGSMAQVEDELGINVVGAGVSTCAPTE